MGMGYHGGFGATKGSYKMNYTGEYQKTSGRNYTRDELIAFLEGKTAQSSIIAEKIKKGEIRLSVIGDELFEKAFGVKSDIVGIAIDNKIYLRKNSVTLHSDIVHEGTHALDFLKGLSYDKISSWDGEIKAYIAEHYFQKASGLAIQFDNEDDIKVHVWKNYRKRGGR
jgi:hypothetical protein